ncbi:hypothetical protein AMAG_15696 [Allomyces macrogynus ATCC 38327]|uniref:Uncharacterized protein n=1 Tax=Allomyces macrogynus (strain ATCC 38327) TaxID=578462 RepID=A0A0L0T9U7_ALLM3|nr:hypothetical protein AMAG_15696 [Allomyces macrogynus ATCC 38327]|eukprot:KNE71470.1 hypothetical protein AMAG_15696 [Allomyces macrogynus ATCC 38327]
MDLDPTPTSSLDPVHDLAAMGDGSPDVPMDDVPAEGEETLPDVAHGIAAWSLWKQLLRNDVGQRTICDRPTKFMDDSELLSDLDGDESSGSEMGGVKDEESDDDDDDDDDVNDPVDAGAAVEVGARSPHVDLKLPFPTEEREQQWERDLAPYRTRAPSSSAAPTVPFDFVLSSSGPDSDDDDDDDVDDDDLTLPAGVRRSAPDPSTDPIAALFPAHRVHPFAPALVNPRNGPQSGLHNQMARQAAMSIHEGEEVEYDSDFVDKLASHMADSTMDQVDALLQGMADAAGFVLRIDSRPNGFNQLTCGLSM